MWVGAFQLVPHRFQPVRTGQLLVVCCSCQQLHWPDEAGAQQLGNQLSVACLYSSSARVWSVGEERSVVLRLQQPREQPGFQRPPRRLHVGAIAAGCSLRQ